MVDAAAFEVERRSIGQPHDIPVKAGTPRVNYFA
jgi:hypothetical protein